MSIFVLFAAFMLAQAEPFPGGVDGLGPMPEETTLASDAPVWRTPPAPDPYARCRCEDVDADSLVAFTGIVTDAVVLLADNGRDPAPRQAAIFRVLSVSKGDVSTPAKVWHATDPAACGVTFDYGKRYSVVAVKIEDELETNWCVMPRPGR